MSKSVEFAFGELNGESVLEEGCVKAVNVGVGLAAAERLAIFSKLLVLNSIVDDIQRSGYFDVFSNPHGFKLAVSKAIFYKWLLN